MHNQIEIRKLLRKNAPKVYADLVLHYPEKRIPNETLDDFIKDLEEYNNKLSIELATRVEQKTWKKL